jgi:hypothetical protein
MGERLPMILARLASNAATPASFRGHRESAARSHDVTVEFVPR